MPRNWCRVEARPDAEVPLDRGSCAVAAAVSHRAHRADACWSTKMMPVLVVMLVTLVGCSPDPETERLRRTVRAEYDEETGRLSQITYDSNDDGNVDTWSYMDGTRVIRVEMDRDEDGVIDRWEYYDEAGVLQKVGMSRVKDGRPDAWMFPDDEGAVARIEVSTRRDDVINRWEWYEQDALVREAGDDRGDRS